MKTILLVVVSFMICWLPMTIGYFIIAVQENRDFHRKALSITVIITHLNSAIDPIIYAYRIKDVRNTLKKIFGLKNSSENTIKTTLGTGNDSGSPVIQTNQ